LLLHGTGHEAALRPAGAGRRANSNEGLTQPAAWLLALPRLDNRELFASPLRSSWRAKSRRQAAARQINALERLIDAVDQASASVLPRRLTSRLSRVAHVMS